MTARVPQLPLVLSAMSVALYLLAPAAPASIFGSWPLTAAGSALFAAAVGVGLLAHRIDSTFSTPPRWILLFVGLIAARVLLASAAVETGWRASYYGNDSWSGRPEWSSDFRFADATRVDRQLSFAGAAFPTHYLNGVLFSKGNDRQRDEPMTVAWTGGFALPEPRTISAAVRAAGSASLSVNGSELLVSTGSVTKDATLPAGWHSVIVRYHKPAGVEGLIDVSLNQDGTPIKVFPSASANRQRPAVNALVYALDLFVAILFMAIAWQSAARLWRSSDRVPAIVGAAVVVGLGVQGYVMALPFAARFTMLTAGDDWFGFESRAREILQNGPLMRFGQPLGEGAAYFYHPFYSYFLAVVHALTGESLFGPIFVHFLILAATALLMFSLARSLFGTAAAVCGLFALLALFEVDFIRYYTITLLSENLYVLTVTLCLVAFADWARTGRVRPLIQAGLWAGVSSATRPAMMMFLMPALAVTFAIASQHCRGRWPLQATAIAAASWMAVIMPFTIRNWMVAGRLVLISDSLGGTFIVHNLPRGVDASQYVGSGPGSIFSGLAGLWRLAIEHPAGVASLQLQKLGFTLGMVHWFDGYRPHPELAAITVLYVITIVTSPVMRRPELWPIHAFVFSHVASMALTSPWNYGYRLILPPFVYTTTLSVAAASAMAWAVAKRRADQR